MPGVLHVHYVPAGSGAVNGTRIGGYERLAAAFAEADAPVFIRENFRKANVDGALEAIKSPDPLEHRGRFETAEKVSFMGTMEAKYGIIKA